MERDNTRLTTILEQLQDNIGRLVAIGEAQVRLEERQLNQAQAIDRCFDAMETQGEVFDRQIADLSARVKPLEADAPAQRITHSWVLDGVKWLAILGVGVLLGKNFL